MDGVIVDFESGLAQQSEQTLKEYEGRHDEVPGLFGVMKPMPGAMDAVRRLNEYYDCYILSTAPWKNRRTRLSQNTNNVQRKRFRITGNPSRFEMSAHRGKISFSASTKSSPDQYR